MCLCSTWHARCLHRQRGVGSSGNVASALDQSHLFSPTSLPPPPFFLKSQNLTVLHSGWPQTPDLPTQPYECRGHWPSPAWLQVLGWGISGFGTHSGLQLKTPSQRHAHLKSPLSLDSSWSLGTLSGVSAACAHVLAQPQ